MMPLKSINEAQHSVFLNLLYAPLIPFFNYLSMSGEAMVILGILLIVDFFSGILNAYVNKIPITYERAVAGVASKVLVLSIPFVLAFMAVAIHKDILSYLNYVLSALIIAEGYSIFGNYLGIRTRHKNDELDIISFVIRGIRSFLEKLLKGFKL